MPQERAFARAIPHASRLGEPRMPIKNYLRTMKKIIYLLLVVLSCCSSGIGEEEEIVWTSSKELLGHYWGTVSRDGDKVKFRARDSGERFFYSVNDEPGNLIEYGQEVSVQTGSTLELTGRHTNIRIQVLKESSTVVVLTQRKIDQRSHGGKVVTSRSGFSIDAEGKEKDIEKVKADLLFNGKKSSRGNPRAS